MTKTWDDYYNDPTIVHEPGAMREIHAIRLMKADERKDYTRAEYTALVNTRADAFLAECWKHKSKSVAG